MTTEWHERWKQGRIGFHLDAPNPELTEYIDHLGSPPARILVPLCGKSVDMMWLAARGYEVVGIELVPAAIDAFLAEHELASTCERHGALTVHRADRITLVCGDIFEVGREHIGAIDGIWDRAALIALPPEARRQYATHLQDLAPGALMLLSAFEYDSKVMDGPPYSVSPDQVMALYRDVTLLERRDIIDQLERWKQAGHKVWWRSIYTIRLPG